MNIKPQDILARLQTIVDEQTGIESALAQMDEQRSTLTTRHAELTALLTAVCGALGVSVAKAPEEPAVELDIAAKAEPSKPANDDGRDVAMRKRIAAWISQRDGEFCPNDLHDVCPAYDALMRSLSMFAQRGLIVRVRRGIYRRAESRGEHDAATAAKAPLPTNAAQPSIVARAEAWVKLRDKPFTGNDLRKAVPNTPHGTISYVMSTLANRRVIVRVERGRYMRADLVQTKPKPVAAPAPVSHATDAPKRDDASPSRYDRVRAWCLTQTGTITASMASAAFPNETPGNVAISLGNVARRGDILRRVTVGEYERVIVAAPAMPQAQQEAA